MMSTEWGIVVCIRADGRGAEESEEIGRSTGRDAPWQRA